MHVGENIFQQCAPASIAVRSVLRQARWLPASSLDPYSSSWLPERAAHRRPAAACRAGYEPRRCRAGLAGPGRQGSHPRPRSAACTRPADHAAPPPAWHAQRASAGLREICNMATVQGAGSYSPRPRVPARTSSSSTSSLLLRCSSNRRSAGSEQREPRRDGIDRDKRPAAEIVSVALPGARGSRSRGSS